MRRLYFNVPSGSSGKRFIRELTKWIDCWNNENSAFREVALKIAMIMPAILLQKPHFKTKAKEHKECLNRRLDLWEAGNFEALLSEIRAIQKKLSSPTNNKTTNDNLAKTFAKLILQGKIRPALRLLEKADSKGIISLSPEVLEELKENILMHVQLMNL